MSEPKKVQGQPIVNLLYTRESKDSAERTKAELDIQDPQQDKAVGILSGEQPNDNEAVHDESQSA